MNLPYRIQILSELGRYMLSDSNLWKDVKEKSYRENGWFIPEFINLAVSNIAKQFLKKEVLENWATFENVPEVNQTPCKAGIIMAGNIPLVGFHDLLSVFISGHQAIIKPSTKDSILIKHLVAVMQGWDDEIRNQITFSEMLKNCNAYIATGSNNSSRYFEYYFGRYPHIIRRNRTSVAILTGDETDTELSGLADDVYQYFGLGCRNVTKIYVPSQYDFIPLLNAFKKYNWMADHHKYKNNYDYNLALHILNKKYYMTNGSIILTEEASVFSPISQLNYEFYSEKEQLLPLLEISPDLQCIISREKTGFGKAQFPAVSDYADGVNTLSFLKEL
ncbi:MAG: acyl-CoA reductase [Bacteroidetes bacterium]|nr:acyl-CoA reductase [Bacteroidota bacterium]MBS1930424.1 acyl-CoA reductase [Bacteroidota bacterium]